MRTPDDQGNSFLVEYCTPWKGAIIYDVKQLAVYDPVPNRVYERKKALASEREAAIAMARTGLVVTTAALLYFGSGRVMCLAVQKLK